MRRQESRAGGVAIGGDVELPLTDQLSVDGSEDTALPLPQTWVGLSRFSHAQNRRRLPTVVRDVAKELRERVGPHPERPLDRGDTLGPGRGLPQQPLRHRCLRDAERGGQVPLRHAALPAGALECLPEPPALLGGCHVTASGSVIRADVTSMPDRPTVDRLSLHLKS